MFGPRKTLVAALGAIALTASFGLADSPRDRATGGGQVLVSTEGGAGDTIAFTAQNTAAENDGDAANGNLTYQDREGGTGKDHVTYHGDVTCLVVSGNTAKLAGQFRDGTPFQLLVVDNGQGAAAEDDIVTLQKDNVEPTCGEDDDDDDADVALARGNAQVHDAA